MLPNHKNDKSYYIAKSANLIEDMWMCLQVLHLGEPARAKKISVFAQSKPGSTRWLKASYAYAKFHESFLNNNRDQMTSLESLFEKLLEKKDKNDLKDTNFSLVILKTFMKLMFLFNDKMVDDKRVNGEQFEQIMSYIEYMAKNLDFYNKKNAFVTNCHQVFWGRLNELKISTQLIDQQKETRTIFFVNYVLAKLKKKLNDHCIIINYYHDNELAMDSYQSIIKKLLLSIEDFSEELSKNNMITDLLRNYIKNELETLKLLVSQGQIPDTQEEMIFGFFERHFAYAFNIDIHHLTTGKPIKKNEFIEAIKKLRNEAWTLPNITATHCFYIIESLDECIFDLENLDQPLLLNLLEFLETNLQSTKSCLYGFFDDISEYIKSLPFNEILINDKSDAIIVNLHIKLLEMLSKINYTNLSDQEKKIVSHIKKIINLSKENLFDNTEAKLAFLNFTNQLDLTSTAQQNTLHLASQDVGIIRGRDTPVSLHSAEGDDEQSTTKSFSSNHQYGIDSISNDNAIIHRVRSQSLSSQSSTDSVSSHSSLFPAHFSLKTRSIIATANSGLAKTGSINFEELLIQPIEEKSENLDYLLPGYFEKRKNYVITRLQVIHSEIKQLFTTIKTPWFYSHEKSEKVESLRKYFSMGFNVGIQTAICNPSEDYRLLYKRTLSFNNLLKSLLKLSLHSSEYDVRENLERSKLFLNQLLEKIRYDEIPSGEHYNSIEEFLFKLRLHHINLVDFYKINTHENKLLEFIKYTKSFYKKIKSTYQKTQKYSLVEISKLIMCYLLEVQKICSRINEANEIKKTCLTFLDRKETFLPNEHFAIGILNQINSASEKNLFEKEAFDKLTQVANSLLDFDEANFINEVAGLKIRGFSDNAGSFLTDIRSDIIRLENKNLIMFSPFSKNALRYIYNRLLLIDRALNKFYKENPNYLRTGIYPNLKKILDENHQKLSDLIFCYKEENLLKNREAVKNCFEVLDLRLSVYCMSVALTPIIDKAVQIITPRPLKTQNVVSLAATSRLQGRHDLVSRQGFA